MISFAGIGGNFASKHGNMETWGQAPGSPRFPMRLPCFIGDQFSGTSALLWGQATLGFRFECLDERCFTQRTSGVRSAPDGEKLRFRFSLLQEALPTSLRPLVAPRRHVQAGVGIGPSAMRGGARPRPRRRFPHHSGAHRIQFRIAQRCPQVARVHGAGIKSALPHMSAEGVGNVPIRGKRCQVPFMNLFQVVLFSAGWFAIRTGLRHSTPNPRNHRACFF